MTAPFRKDGALPDGILFQLSAARAWVKSAPRPDAESRSELLFGERFVVTAEEQGWCFGYSEHDRYIGYVPRRHLSRHLTPPSHVVAVNIAPVLIATRQDSPVSRVLSLGSLVSVSDMRGDFMRVASGKWMWNAHLAPLPLAPIGVLDGAFRYLGVPFAWGGRSIFGMDCAALVQMSTRWAGLRVERDIPEQRATVGRVLDPAEPILPGDIVFFRSHAAIFVDADTVLHTSASARAVVIDDYARLRRDQFANDIYRRSLLRETTSVTPVIRRAPHLK